MPAKLLAMPPLFFPTRYYIVAVVVLAALFALTLYGRIVYFDDGWSAEQSYWLLHDGRVRSEFFRGIDGVENQNFVYHKGFIYVQAAVMRVLGTGIYAAKTTALLFGGLGLGLLLRYFRAPQPAAARGLAAALYLGCGTLVLFGFNSRPETLVMCCGFGSYLLLRRPAAGAGRLALAAALAGVAAIAHLNGLIYIAAGALWLWRRRGWRVAFGFGLVAGLTASLYLLDALAAGQLGQFWRQFTHYPEMQSNHHWASKLQVLIEYQRLFFHSEGEAPLTILLLLTVLLTLVGVRRPTPPAAANPTGARLPPALHYLLLLIGAMWLLTKSDSAFYYLLFLPFIVVVVVELSLGALPYLAPWRRQLLRLAVLLYPIGSFLRAYHLVQESRAYPRAEVENARLAAHMPRHGGRVIAPLDFMFGQIDNYKMRSLTYFAYLNADRYAGQLPVEDFFQLALQDSAQYVVTDFRVWNHAYHVLPNAPARIGRYQRVFQDQWHSVYARQPADHRPPIPTPPRQLELNLSSF